VECDRDVCTERVILAAKVCMAVMALAQGLGLDEKGGCAASRGDLAVTEGQAWRDSE
jgi:hypothetical protein